MGQGYNLVLFDPSIANSREVEYLRVTAVQHETRSFYSNEQPYDLWTYSELTTKPQA